jgi:hypothetical protein
VRGAVEASVTFETVVNIAVPQDAVGKGGT